VTVNGVVSVSTSGSTLSGLPAGHNTAALLYCWDTAGSRFRSLVVEQGTSPTLNVGTLNATNCFAFLLDGAAGDNGGSIQLTMAGTAGTVWAPTLGAVANCLNLDAAAVPATPIPAGSYTATVAGAASGLPGNENDRVLIYYRNVSGKMSFAIVRAGQPATLQLPQVDATGFFAFVLDGTIGDNTGALTLTLQRN
jgi:hypothetical protein